MAPVTEVGLIERLVLVAARLRGDARSHLQWPPDRASGAMMVALWQHSNMETAMFETPRCASSRLTSAYPKVQFYFV